LIPMTRLLPSSLAMMLRRQLRINTCDVRAES
jgi:hypothetical protein